MIEKGDLLTLSNNKTYIVASIIEYQGEEYIYLIEKDGISDIKFCVKESDDTLKIVTDPNIIIKLITRFSEEIKNGKF